MSRPAVLAVIVLLVLTGCGGGSDSSGSSSGSTSSSSSDEDASSGSVDVLDPCQAVSVDEVGAILDGTFTSEVGPFDACEFDQEDPRATSFSIDAQAESELGGGFEVYKSGSKAAFTDAEQIDLSDLGDQAFITTGRFADGENTQLQGAVLVDGQVLTVSLTQASGIAKDVLVDQGTQLLTLIASKA